MRDSGKKRYGFSYRKIRKIHDNGKNYGEKGAFENHPKEKRNILEEKWEISNQSEAAGK